MQLRSKCVYRTALVVVSSVALAGCLGGGGGSSSGRSSNASAAGASTPVSLPPSANRTLTLFIPDAKNAKVADRSGAGGSDIDLNQTSVSVRPEISGKLAGGKAPPTTSTLVKDLSSSGTSVSVYEAGENALIDSKMAGTSTLSDASYGILFTSSVINGNTVGGYHQGNATAASSMPTNVTATYNGTFAGFELKTGRDLNSSTANNAGTLVGDATVTANFGAGTVAGTVNNLRYEGNNDVTDQTAGYSMSMNGTISGNAYNGSAAFTDASTGATAGTTNRSNVSGAFYGAGAAETAGAITLEGKSPGSRAANVAVVGAFGAKK